VYLRCGGTKEEDALFLNSREISRSRGPCGILRKPRNNDAVSFRRTICRALPFLVFLSAQHFLALAPFNATALYMWRSNVLGLRKCSSTATARYGLTTRWYSSGKSLPIDEKEFEAALGKVLTWKWDTLPSTPLGT
jgi:hypothetical protein